MKRFLLCFLLLGTVSAQAGTIYTKDFPPVGNSAFDLFLKNFWERNQVKPALEASDAVMVRRLYVTLAGRVPTPQEAERYVSDPLPDKLPKLVRELLASKDFRTEWTMRMGDELRIKSEFPINLWPNATFVYSKTISDFWRNNPGYDQFAAKLLLSQGSNFREGGVNFYRAVPKKDARSLAEAVSVFFLGTPWKELSAESQRSLTEIFGGVRYKATKEWKEEIVYYLPPDKETALVFPDGKKLTAPAGSDLRKCFWEWLTDRRNPYFAKGAVSRFWRWSFGNEPQGEIVAFLGKQWAGKDFDCRELLQTILCSTAYRCGSVMEGDADKARKFHAAYPITRLDAETIRDSIAQITGTKYEYSSVIPEPFSYHHCRAAELTDGSVADSFLLLFGRPSRDAGTPEERNNAITTKQRLFLYNSRDLHQRLSKIRPSKWGHKVAIDEIYQLFYSRPPTEEEREIARELYEMKGKKNIVQSLAWVLMNSKEFLYQH